MPPVDLGPWLIGRLTSRRQAHTNPIVVGLLGSDVEEQAALEAAVTAAARALGGVFVCDVSRVARDLGLGFRSDRTGAKSRITDVKIAPRCRLPVASGSNGCRARCSRGSRRLRLTSTAPGILGGVLGEDGPAEVAMTPDHALVQERLRSLGTQAAPRADLEEHAAGCRAAVRAAVRFALGSPISPTRRSAGSIRPPIRRAAERRASLPKAFLCG